MTRPRSWPGGVQVRCYNTVAGPTAIVDALEELLDALRGYETRGVTRRALRFELDTSLGALP